MIRFALTLMKVTVFSIVVLVISQIHVGNKRICDHVRDVVQHGTVQYPLHWIAARFNFLEGHKAIRAGSSRDTDAEETGSESSESDRGRLSGLLKSRSAKH